MNFRITFILLSAFVLACSQNQEKVLILPDNPNISYSGRFDMSDKTEPVFMYSGCGIRTVFTGTSAELILKDDSLRNLFTVVLDDSVFVIQTNRADSTYTLAKNLAKGEHNLEIYRRTEWHGGNSTFLGLKLDPRAKVIAPAKRAHLIEFIGDSYTCGYGNEGKSQDEHFTYETENNYMSYGAITARNLDADYMAVCRSGIGIVHGYGGGRGFNMPCYYDEVTMDSTVMWDYTRYQPDLVFIDLIANDLSAPLDSTEFATRYLEFLTRIRSNYPNASIVCAAGPASPGKGWETTRSYIRNIVDASGINDPKVSYFEFSPFVPTGSDWHPTVAQHQQMAKELTPYLKNLMNW